MGVCNESKPYIFISYSHRDSEKVIEIMNRLRKEGYNVWYDGGIDPGTEWDENIAKHVQECAYFIAFVSNGYIGSKNCKDELNYSRDLDKNQLLVYLEDVQLPGGMAMRMNRIQAIYWNKYDDSNRKEAYEKLFMASGIEVTKITENGQPVVQDEIRIPVAVDSKADTSKGKKTAILIAAIVAVILLAVGGIALFSGGSDNKEETVAVTEEENEAEVKEQEETDSAKEDISDLSADELYELGNSYMCGTDDCEVDKVKAFEYYMEAAELGHDKAMLTVGVYYFNGDDIEKDREKATEWYKKAADAGNAQAMLNLGNCYRTGTGVEKDFEKAREYLEKAKAAGLEEAQEGLDMLDGEQTTDSEASVEELCTMARNYMNGENGFEKDQQKGMEYYLAAAQKDSLVAIGFLYNNYYYGNEAVEANVEEAMKWLAKGVELENCYCLYTMGLKYKDGLDGVEQNPDKAFECFYRSAELNYPLGIWGVGHCYEKGIGVEKNEETAYQYYLKAAETGNGYCLLIAGYCTQYGIGTDPDPDKAREFYQKSLDAGYTKAQKYLDTL